MPKKETVYNQDAKTLVNQLLKMAHASAVANSGLCIDSCGPAYARDEQYFEGAVLARLEGKQPPFEPDTVVVPKSVPHYDKNVEHQIVSKDPLKIDRVFYITRWYLQFVDQIGLYDAKNYDAVPAPIAA